MSSDVRWVALLPDPVMGSQLPVVDSAGKPREWLAPDKVTARTLVSQTLTQPEFWVCDVVSVLEWEARKNDAKRVNNDRSLRCTASGRIPVMRPAVPRWQRRR